MSPTCADANIVAHLNVSEVACVIRRESVDAQCIYTLNLISLTSEKLYATVALRLVVSLLDVDGNALVIIIKDQVYSVPDIFLKLPDHALGVQFHVVEPAKSEESHV